MFTIERYSRMESQQPQTTCKYCGKLLTQTDGRTHRKREYCTNVHRQLAYRQRKEREARAASQQRWREFLPTTQALLEEILHLRGEAFARRVTQVIADEVASVQETQQHGQQVEERFRTDVTVQHFKPWLRRHDQPRDTDFFRRFLADTRLPQHASRALYEARLRLYGYSAEDIALFQGAWKEMLFTKS